MFLGTLAFACPESVEPAKLTEQISQSLESFRVQKFEEFEQGREAAMKGLDCLSGPISKRTAVMIHQSHVYHSFFKRDYSSMGSSLLAVHRLDPDVEFHVELFPSSHPIRKYIAFGLQQKGASLISISKPITGMIYVDGQLSSKIPQDQAFVFQRLDSNNQALQTDWISAGARPDYSKWGDEQSFSPKLQQKFTYAAGVTALFSAGFGIAAHAQESKFWDDNTPKDDLKGLQTDINMLSSVALGFGVVSCGLLSAALITGAW